MSWSRSLRSALWLKAALAVGLVALADVLFFTKGVGSTMGAFALAVAACAGMVRPAMWWDRRAAAAFVVAVAFALALVDHPTLLGWCLFWAALMVAGLSPRLPSRASSLVFAERLVLSGFMGLIAPVRDALRLRAGRRARGRSWLTYWPQLVLPLIGGVVFVGLFIAANPVIDSTLRTVSLGEIDAGRVVFWTVFGLLAWMALRPRFAYFRRRPALPGPLEPPGVTVLSVGLSLALFNLLFAVQNGLDIVFLWSGAPLPGKVTMADYAHRGAYTLILTAILAGAFVVFALRPGSTTARSRPLRILVLAWLAQTLLLVASSMLRTWDYVQSYGLTVLRASALIWMVLVAVGLGLVCLRLLRGKSGVWLVDANVCVAGVALAACAVIDLGAVSATWNVAHAEQIASHGVALDISYIARQGSAAAVPLGDLLRHSLPTSVRSEVEQARAEILTRLRADQSDWRTWTWRGARRLERAKRQRPPGGLQIVGAYDPYAVQG